jgi:guanylate kinase
MAKQDLIKELPSNIEERKRVGKVLEEATRRYKADEIDFAKMKEICDYVVVNEVLDNAVNRVLDIIECNL